MNSPARRKVETAAHCTGAAQLPQYVRVLFSVLPG